MSLRLAVRHSYDETNQYMLQFDRELLSPMTSVLARQIIKSDSEVASPASINLAGWVTHAEGMGLWTRASWEYKLEGVNKRCGGSKCRLTASLRVQLLSRPLRSSALRPFVTITQNCWLHYMYNVYCIVLITSALLSLSHRFIHSYRILSHAASIHKPRLKTNFERSGIDSAKKETLANTLN